MGTKEQAEAVAWAQLMAFLGETPESAAKLVKENKEEEEEENDKSADE